VIARLAPIVEGHGDAASVRILVNAILNPMGIYVEVAKPIRLDRGKIVKPEEFGRHIELARINAGKDGAILVMFDSDGECPLDLSRSCCEILDRRGLPYLVSVAHHMYENWFIASADSLMGKRGLTSSYVSPLDPESVASPKSWLERHHVDNSRSKKVWTYSERVDQPALTSYIIPSHARSSRSFRHLEDGLLRLFCP